ncbi:MAG TPA: aspartyl/asparaginyl beta-hydroxylase domain-containing protein [Sphingomicrobium sp.]|nr:aspartyl/asparaginyl beta-hydroxylase domain-containing protein [Sphingomicrobium sp.]
MHSSEDQLTVGCVEHSGSLIAQADQAMARGDVRQAASLLEVAAQRGRDSTTLLRLATVRRSLGDLGGALQAATAAVELSPRNFLMCLLLGSLREATGALHAAQRAYRSARDHAPLDLSLQPAMAKQLELARKRVEAAEHWHKRVLEWDPADAPYELTCEEERRLRGFRTNILENVQSGPIAPPIFMVPGIKPKRYFEPLDFAGIAELEQATAAIRDEFLAIAEGKSALLSSRLKGLHSAEIDESRPGVWSMIPLMKNGSVVDDFASRCPLTMRLAKKLDLPKLGLISPSLYFSVLEPNSRIAPHSGITNARLIAHLPLIVPDNCGLRVGGETRRWEVGKALVFDDMTSHEAWNDSDRIRVVLIADLWRPELSAAERAAVNELMDCRNVAAPN